MSERFAAVDVGTSTVLLTVAEIHGRELTPVLERATITRLGQGVDRTRRLDAEARARTLRVLREYGALAHGLGVSAAAAVCTSAVRDAENGAEFLEEAGAALGREVSVLAGAEEAALTFEGALSGLALDGPVLVFDVGGGSTEIIRGLAGAALSLEAAVSLDIGSVRLTERHITTDPPGPEELARIRSQVSSALAAAPRAPASGALVGVAGTVTTLAAIDAGMNEYDAATVHGSILRRDRLEGLAKRLAEMTFDERVALPGLERGRADVIVAGAQIVCELMDHSGRDELLVSDRGVRWGLLARMAQDSETRSAG